MNQISLPKLEWLLYEKKYEHQNKKSVAPIRRRDWDFKSKSVILLVITLS